MTDTIINPNTYRNAAKCLKCGTTIESKSVHDYVTCKCGNLSVDGGLEYAKRNFRDGMNSWIDLCGKEKPESFCDDCDVVDNPKCGKCLGS